MSETGSRRVERPRFADERRASEDDDPREGIRPLEDDDDTAKGINETARLAVLESENEALKSRLSQSETNEQKLAREAATNRTAAAQAQEQQIKGAVETAKSEVENAKAKYKSAREAGDIDAETEANALLSNASAKLATAEDTNRRYEAWKAQQKNAPPPQQQPKPATDVNEPTPEVRAWFEAHPAYFKDADYQARALAAHEGALSRQIPEGSKAYVDYIDKALERQLGPGHGQLDKRNNGGTVNNRRASSEAAPRDRGGDSRDRGGDFEFTHKDGSTLRLVTEKNQNGEYYETVRGTVPAEWREYARINRMSDRDYAVEQMRIQKEISEGGNLSNLSRGMNGVYE